MAGLFYKKPLAHNSFLPLHSQLSLTPISNITSSSSSSSSAAAARTPDMGYSGWEHEYQPPHFLDSCSLCGRQLSQNTDIFMYRGNTPFCSQECRQEQIEMDEAMEKKWKMASSSSSSSSSSKRRQTTSESDTSKAVRTGTTVAVA